MHSYSAPDALARFDHEQWQKLKLEAERRGADAGAYVSWLLTRQVHRS